MPVEACRPAPSRWLSLLPRPRPSPADVPAVGCQARRVRTLRAGDTPRRYAQWRREPGVRHENVQARPGEELGRYQTRYLPDRLTGQRVQFFEAAEPGQRGHHVSQTGNEPEPGLGDDGQSALGPGEQGRVVVAGVVLDQPGQVRQDGAVREDGFDTAQLRAHRPEAQDSQPAALVATAPPTVALPRLAMRIPRSRPGSASATC